jgi:hypothetical protein
MVKVYWRENTVNPSLPQSGKKPYSTPVMKIYGDIRVITQSIGMNVTVDGGTFPNPTKT